jgi:asparagine synthase (glutamine-hydrolysing)
MCGIFGIWDLTGAPVDLARVHRATSAIKHRGPDDEGYLLANARAGTANPSGGPDTDQRLPLNGLDRYRSEHFDLAFGFRRLSIIDLSPAGHQPMASADRKRWIVFNGEIYNYQELRTELSGRGHEFRTATDTEVILAAYAEWGAECVQQLNGMFAFAIWDVAARTLFVARDRFGEKPLFYVHQPGRLFAFASEMKALWAAEVIGRRIHDPTLALFTTFGQVEVGEQTIYHDTLRLPQAHTLTLTADGRLQKRRYWDIDPRIRNEGRKDEEYADEFRERFMHSVRLRLHADVPVGSSLSGGLDSSTVVSVISRLLPEHAVQKTFSARFDDPSRDEGRWMDLVTANNRLERHDVWPNAERFFEELGALTWHQEEPFTSASVYAQWSVMRLARENEVTVLLDGQGADEMLAGYHSYFNEITDDFLNALDLRGYLKWRKDCLTLHGTVPGSVGRVFIQRMPRALKRLVRNGLRRNGTSMQAEPSSPVYPREFENVSSLRKLLWWSTTREGLVELLRYADRNSMAHSREVRLPFLDHTLVEFVFTLPDRMLVRDGWTKWILRKAFTDIVPTAIRSRVDKLGYMPPQERWLGALNWRELMTDHVVRLTNQAATQPAGGAEAVLPSRP